MRELSDDEVFGTPAAMKAPGTPVELSDADVFGDAAPVASHWTDNLRDPLAGARVGPNPARPYAQVIGADAQPLQSAPLPDRIGSVLEDLPADPSKFDFRAASQTKRAIADLQARQQEYGTIGPIKGPAPSLGSIFSGVVNDLAVGGRNARAGIRQMAADVTGNQSLADQAMRERAQAGLQSAINTPEFESDTARSIYGGVSSTVRQLPAIAAAIATRNPNVALGGMVAPMVPEEYGKFRERGAAPGTALAAAAGSAATEYLTEKLPMSYLVGGLGRLGAGQFLAGMLAREVPGEQVATLVQDAIDTATANPSKTWGEYLAERPGSAYQTLLATLTQSAIMGGANAVATRASGEQRAQDSGPTLKDYEALMAASFKRKPSDAQPAPEQAPQESAAPLVAEPATARATLSDRLDALASRMEAEGKTDLAREHRVKAQEARNIERDSAAVEKLLKEAQDADAAAQPPGAPAAPAPAAPGATPGQAPGNAAGAEPAAAPVPAAGSTDVEAAGVDAPAAPVLQNRDRSTPSSVAQMQSIAAAPDYGRLGFSRDFANGAPVVAGGQVSPDQMGRADVAVASDGRRIPVQYAVVEAADVLPSNTVDGSTNAEYATATDRMRAIAGNGRIAGLQSAYQRGTQTSYLQELGADTLHGIDPQVIQGMRAPVLVRVMPTDQISADIGDVSNTTGNLDLSAVEQARNDSQRVALDSLQFSNDGAITPETVRQFVRAMPKAEHGTLLDTNGQPTRQAVDRINAAVFAKAYGNDGLVRLYAQAQDPEARLVLAALARVAPKMARLEGAGALDIRDVVAQAAEIAVNARRAGKRIADAAQQMDMAADPMVGLVLDLFARNPRSNREAIEALGNAADMAYAEANKPAEDMFGAVPRATRGDVLNQLEPQRNEQASPQNLGQPAGPGPVQADAGRPAAEPRAAADPGPAQAGRPAEAAAAEPEGLTSYSADELRQRADDLDSAQTEQRRQDSAADKAERQARERDEIRQRSEAAADTFELGQDPLDNLSGQGGMFGNTRVEARSKGYSNGQTDLFEQTSAGQQIDLWLNNGPDPSQAGPRGEAAQSAAAAAVADIYATETLLGLALSRDYAARQRANLVGQEVKSAADLAVLAQVYRDPRFETFRLVFVNSSGGVVSQVGLTSRLPGSATAVIGSDVDTYLRDISEAARNTGATGFYMLHNHPSGISAASNADRGLTASFAARMPMLEFKDHVVIDTNEYTTIDRSGRVQTHHKDFGQPAPMTYGEWGGRVIQGPDDIMAMAKQMAVDENAVTLITLDSQLRVKGVTEIASSAIGSDKTANRRAVLKATMRQQGARVVAVGRDMDVLRRLDGMVLDAVMVMDSGLPRSLAERGIMQSSGLFPEDRRTRLSPDTSGAFDYLRAQTAPEVAAPSQQRVAESGTDEATGLPLNEDGTVTVYHHTSAARAAQIKNTGRLKSAAEPDVYLTTWPETDTGYGDTAVAVNIDPELLQVDDEFPSGRMDFRVDTGRPGGSISVKFPKQRVAEPGPDQTQTPAFKRWFGDSKVVDADGEPLVVYHGTEANFVSFSGDGNGLIHFARDVRYIDSSVSGATHILPVYLHAVNPFDGGNKLHVEKLRADGASDYLLENTDDWGVLEQNSSVIRRSGFDAIQTEEWVGEDDDARAYSNIAVFSPSQIKSATGNNGAFDPANPSIVAEPGKQYRSTDAGKSAAEISRELEAEYPGLVLDLFGRGARVTLSRIVVPKGSRDTGTGTKAMQRIEAWADANGVTVGLTPSGDFGGSKARLVPFYKRFGFVENKGRSRDFEISESMYRSPQAGRVESPQAQYRSTTGGNVNNLASAAAPWHVPEAGTGDALIRSIQNNKIDLKRLRDTLEEQYGRLSDKADAYLNEELYHGKVAARVERLHESTVKPILAKIAVAGKNAGVTVDDVNLYLHARHAPERNAAMQKINPGMANNDGLSGLTDQQAASAIAQLRTDGKLQALQTIATDIDNLIADTRTNLVADGLEDAAVVQAWESAYQHYVPLQRDVEGQGAGASKGMGFSVKGPEAKRAVGSNREVVNILANIVAQAETATIRAEKAKVGRSLLEMAQSNPNPDFWTVDVPPTKPRINKDTGLVERNAIDPLYQTADNVVMVKDQGQVHYIVFNKNNERAALTANAMKNLDVAPLNKGIVIVGSATRFMASMLTARNPEFWVTNFARDVQGAMMNLEGTDAAGTQAKVLANMPSAFKGMHSLVRGDGTGQWARAAKEMQEAGGTTGYMQSFDSSDDRMGDLRKEVDRMQQGKADPRRLGRTMLEFIEDYNDIIENAVRLSVYQAARDGGLSIPRAASLAKNITVNFNRKGNLSPVINSLYMFFNASIQGTARMMYSITRSRKAQAIVGGIAGIGFLMDVLNRMAAGEDDETGRNRYDLIPEFEKSKNWIFMNPARPGEYVKVPLPLGPHVFHNAGRLLSDAFNRKDPRNAAEYGFAFAGTVFDAFSPLGGAQSITEMFLPSVADPIAQLEFNKTFTGAPVYKSADRGFGPDDPNPAYTRYFESTPEIWKQASKMLNDITGGDDVKKGAINIEPDILKHIAYTITGGPGRTIDQSIDTLQGQARGEPVPSSRVPFARRFYGENDDKQRERVFYDDRKRVEEAKAEFDNAMKKGRRDHAKEVARELGGGDFDKGMKMLRNAKGTNREIMLINKRIKLLREREQKGDNVTKELLELQKKRTQSMNRNTRRNDDAPD